MKSCHLSKVALVLFATIASAFAQTATFPAGLGPYGIAFDGANIWVTNANYNTVTKLRATDGVMLGTFPTGGIPSGVVFDGANIWVANENDNTVTKLRATDGVMLGTFPTGDRPNGIAFDGANIWVHNIYDNTVTKLRATDGVMLGTFPTGADTGRSGPGSVVFDGANIWVVNVTSAIVTKLRANDGAVLGAFSTGENPRGIAFDGSNIWVANINGHTVTKLRATDGFVLGTFPAGAVGAPAAGVAFDGVNIWVTNGSDNTVAKLRATDGAVLGIFPTGQMPNAVIFDGTNIWVVNSNDNTVTKFIDVLLGDTTPPATTATASPGPNSNGWNNTNITVHLNATDNPGGSGVKQIQFALGGAQNSGWQTVAGNTASVIISAEGTTTLSYFATDNAGNQETAKTLTVRIDKTPPVISGMPPPGCKVSADNNGHQNDDGDHGTLVKVATVTAKDILSGLAPGSFKVTGTSNQPPKNPKNQQIVITPNSSGAFVVRVLPDSSGDVPRVYTLTATAADQAGNAATVTSACTVRNGHEDN